MAFLSLMIPIVSDAFLIVIYVAIQQLVIHVMLNISITLQDQVVIYALRIVFSATVLQIVSSAKAVIEWIAMDYAKFFQKVEMVLMETK